MANDNINPPDLRFDVLVYREDAVWVAHCLQIDIVGTCSNEKDEAINEVIDLCTEQIICAVENGNLDFLVRPAPPEMFERFLKSRKIGSRTTQVEFTKHVDHGQQAIRTVDFQESQEAAV